MKRRQNLVAEAAAAIAPAAAVSGAQYLRRPRKPKVSAPGRPKVEAPGFKTIDKWSPEIGGSKIGQVRVPYDQLVEAFGEPVPTPEGVNGEWWPEVNWYIEFDDGNKAMIYDWKVAGPIEQNTIWSVAGCADSLGYIVSLLGLPPEQVEDQRIMFSGGDPGPTKNARQLARRLVR